MFRSEPVTPATPEAEALAQAILAFLAAERELASAKAQVPDYTGQWDAADYYAEEQERRNRAVDALLVAVRGAA